MTTAALAGGKFSRTGLLSMPLLTCQHVLEAKPTTGMKDFSKHVQPWLLPSENLSKHPKLDLLGHSYPIIPDKLQGQGVSPAERRVKQSLKGKNQNSRPHLLDGGSEGSQDGCGTPTVSLHPWHSGLQ